MASLPSSLNINQCLQRIDLLLRRPNSFVLFYRKKIKLLSIRLVANLPYHLSNKQNCRLGGIFHFVLWAAPSPPPPPPPPP